MTKLRRQALIAPVMLGAVLALARPTGATPAEDPAWTTAEGLVREVYAAVSAAGGQTPDWDRVRSFFLPEAVVVLRTSRTATTVFSVDGFLKDFIDFYARPMKVGDETLQPKITGFTERVVQPRYSPCPPQTLRRISPQ